VLELQLASLGAVPFGREVLLPLLAAYKRPNDKIAEWLREGVLVALKRGLYVVGTPWRRGGVSLPLLANRLYGPSCVSLDYALSLHGLIPERVYEVTSVCMRRGRELDSALGRFTYTRLPSALYPLGIRQEVAAPEVVYLVAGPEKALCDKVLLTPHLQAMGRATMRAFLFEDLRIEPAGLSDLDLGVVRQYVALGGKPRQMQALLGVLEEVA